MAGCAKRSQFLCYAVSAELAFRNKEYAHDDNDGSRGARSDQVFVRGGGRRHADLLQGLGQRTADRLQPRLAADRRRLGRPDGVPRVARLSLHRARPPRPRPIEPAVGRQRDGHLRRRSGGAGRSARSAGRHARRTFDGRRRSRALHRPARHQARRQGGADRRGAAADAEDRRRIPAACRSRCSTRSAPACSPTARSSSRI